MKKQRIKKALVYLFKALVIVFACIGAFFSGFFIVSTIINKVNHEYSDKQLNVAATTPVAKGFLDYDNSSGEALSLYTSTDFNKTDTLLGAIEYLKQYDSNFNEYDTSFSTPYNVSFSMDNVIVDYWAYLRNKIQDNTIYTTPFETLFDSGSYYDTLRFNITYFESYSYWEFRIYLEGGTTTFYSIFTYSKGMTYIPSVSTNYSNAKCIIIKNYSNRGNPLKYILNYDSRSTNFYEDGYRDGYGVGYTAGFSEGNVATTSPFTLISNAFSSIANILNIQILPNLSLGVLIFAPLVIVIIIAIFKIFRG